MTTATVITATPNPDDNPLLAAAVAAVLRGWAVFPLRPGSKVPALHGHDRCPRTGACTDGHVGWEQRATHDPERVRAAWAAGTFNIGVATGPSRLVVIDLDVPDPGETPPPPWNQDGVRDGQDVLAVLADQAGQPYPADTLTVATPSGGLHLYFTAPPGIELRNTAGTRLGWCIDTRAHGGYVLAPGSRVHGQPYRVLHDQQPAPLPAWLTDRLTPTPPAPIPTGPVHTSTGKRSRYVDAALRCEVDRVTNAPKRQRNATLYVAAKSLGQLVAGHALGEDEVVNELFVAAWKHIAVGAFTQSQAMATIRSGLRDGAKNPRQVA